MYLVAQAAVLTVLSLGIGSCCSSPEWDAGYWIGMQAGVDCVWECKIQWDTRLEAVPGYTPSIEDCVKDCDDLLQEVEK